MKLTTTIEEFLMEARLSLAPATVSKYQSHLLGFAAHVGDITLSDITARHIRTWRGSLTDALSPYTIHQRQRTLRRFFNWCLDEGYVSASPVRTVAFPPLPKDHPPRAISAYDLHLMFQAAFKSGPRDYALVRFLADTGCRIGGLITARISDLDTQNRTILLTEKGNKTRPAWFGSETANALRAWLVIRPDHPSNRLFLSQRPGRAPEPMTTSGPRQLLKRLAGEIGITGPHNPHAFRHAFARRMLANGMDISDLSRLMGHSSIQVTAKHYLCWTAAELGQKHAQFNSLDEIKITTRDL